MAVPISIRNMPDHIWSQLDSSSHNSKQNGAGQSYDMLQFPKTKVILWDPTPVGTPVHLGVSCYRKPKVHLSDKLLRLLHRQCENNPKQCLSTILLGSFIVDDDGEGVTFQIDRLDTRQNVDCSLNLAPEDVTIPFQVYINGSKERNCNVEEYNRILKTLQSRCKSKESIDLGGFLLSQGWCNFYSGGENCVVHIDFNIVTIATELQAIPISPVPIVPTALSKNLAGPLSFSHIQGYPKTGYLTMDHTRKLLLVLESDPKALNLPIVGIWISGAPVVHHPFVWAACLRYLHNEHIQDRVCSPPDNFLVVLYSPLHSKPEFYECGSKSGNNNLDFDLYTGYEASNITKNSRNTSMISIDLNNVQVGPKREVFDASLNIFNKNRSGNDIVNEATNKTMGPDDMVPRLTPAPLVSMAPMIQNLVPDVSFVLNEPSRSQVSTSIGNAYSHSLPYKRSNSGSQLPTSLPQKASSIQHNLSPATHRSNSSPNIFEESIPRSGRLAASNIQGSYQNHSTNNGQFLQNNQTGKNVSYQNSPLANPQRRSNGQFSGHETDVPMMRQSLPCNPSAYAQQYVNNNMGTRGQVPSSMSNSNYHDNSALYQQTDNYPSNVPSQNQMNYPQIPFQQFVGHQTVNQNVNSRMPNQQHVPQEFQQQPYQVCPQRPQKPYTQGPSQQFQQYPGTQGLQQPCPQRPQSVRQEQYHSANPQRPCTQFPPQSCPPNSASVSYPTPMNNQNVMHQKNFTNLANYPQQQMPIQNHGPNNNVPQVLEHSHVTVANNSQNPPHGDSTCSGKSSDDSGLSVTPDRSNPSPKTGSPGSRTHNMTKPFSLDTLNKEQCSPEVYNLLMQQDAQLKQLQSQISLLLQTQQTGTSQKSNTSSEQSIDVSGNSKSRSDTCSVAINTSMFYPATSKPVTSEASSSFHKPEVTTTDTQVLPENIPLPPSDGSDSSSAGQTPVEIRHKGMLPLNSTHREDMVPHGDDLSTVINSLGIQDRTISSSHSESVIDCPSFSSSSPRSIYVSKHSSVSPPSASMCIQGSDNSTEYSGDGNSENPLYYENLIANIRQFLDSHDESGEGTKEENDTMNNVTSTSTISSSDQLLLNHSQHLHSLLKSAQSGKYVDTTLIPKISYMSMMFDSDSDQSVEINAMAMKYLKDEQLTQMMKLQNHATAKPNKSGQKKTLLRQLLHTDSPEVSQNGLNDMTFATRKYMEKHGLLNSDIDNIDKSLDFNYQMKTDYSVSSSDMASPLRQPSKPVTRNNNVDAYAKIRLQKSPVKKEIVNRRDALSPDSTPKNYQRFDQSGGQNMKSKPPVPCLDFSPDNSPVFERTKRHEESYPEQRPVEFSNVSEGNDNILDIVKLKQLPKLL